METANLPNHRRPGASSLRSLLPLLLPLLLFLPGLNGFPYASPQAPYSDLVISHYPNALYLKGVLSTWGVIPLWSPTILSGYPFAANPLSGLWYPPGWLALIFPLPLGFNLLAMAHLLLGGWGLYRLLRLEELSHTAALFGALACESLPKLFAHYGAGHLSLVYAVSWTPWLLAAQVASCRLQVRRLSRLQPGLILALIFLADPRWAAYAGLLWLAFTLAHRQNTLNVTSEKRDRTSNIQYPVPILYYLTSNLLLAALLSAPSALPLLEYTRLSTRSALAVEDVFARSLPPARLLGLLYPDFGGSHEWMLYPGGAALALLCVAGFAGLRRKKIRFWLGVFLLSMLFALGSNLPLLPALARIPGFDLLRVPPRALFLTGLAGAVLASYGLEILNGGLLSRSRRVALGLTGLTTFVVVFALAVGVLTRVWERNFLWGAGAILLASLWVLIRPRGHIPPQIWLVGLFGMALLDWGVVNASLLSFHPRESVFSKAQQVAEYLAEQPGQFRVYSPSYSLPQEAAARYGFELADGVDPLQLSAYAAFMERASGVPGEGYSVSLPPFSAGEPGSDNAPYRPDAALLGSLNVGYVVAAYELPVEGLVLREQFDAVWIYENEEMLPRAWVQPNDGRIGVDLTPAEIVDWGPNKISLQAEGPGLLVLAELAYPGWRVSVDGRLAQMETPLDLLRGVQLVSGGHDVIFYYRPMSVYLGLGGLVLGTMMLVWWGKDRHSRKGCR